jgi:hypothetical protein
VWSLVTIRSSAILSFALGLGAVAAVIGKGDDSDHVYLDTRDICSHVQSLVDLLLGYSDVTQICQQLDPSAVGPVTVTVTSRPQTSTTTTVYQT